MSTIKTATGKLFDSDYIATIPQPAMLFLRVLNTDIATVATVFSNPTETALMWYEDICLQGYSEFKSIIPEGDAFKIGLGGTILT